MDVLIVYPLIFQKGGADCVVLEIAKKFNALIYTSTYQHERAFKEFKELDVREIKQPIFEKLLFFLKKDIALYGSVVAGMKFLTYKMKQDYDVINALGNPANWIRNRNERVCWYFYSPVRSAFDLYEFKVAILPFHKRIIKDAAFLWYKFWEKRIDHKIEKTVSNSPYVNERDAKFIKEYIQKPVEPIPGAVDENAYFNESYSKYFLYPLRITPEKRFEKVIEAFNIFSSRLKCKGWKLVIAGALPERERELKYFEMLKKSSHSLNVEFKINLEENEFKHLYANAYAILYYPLNEDLGLPPIEAMASEKPCISINEGGPKYSIINNKIGFLVNSPQEMAQKMLYLGENPEIAEKMGKAGRKHVLKNYTWKIFLNKIEKAFKEVASMKS